jgi:hypothetical protein
MIGRDLSEAPVQPNCRERTWLRYAAIVGGVSWEEEAGLVEIVHRRWYARYVCACATHVDRCEIHCSIALRLCTCAAVNHVVRSDGVLSDLGLSDWCRDVDAQ